MMRKVFVSGLIGVCAVVGGAASARSRSIQDQLMRLSPEERVEQRCNERATGQLGRERKLRAPDEVVAYAFSDPMAAGSSIEAPGAAIRDRGEWYKLSYKCRATPDGLGIVSFEYKLGEKVPRSDWAEHNLSPP